MKIFKNDILIVWIAQCVMRGSVIRSLLKIILRTIVCSNLEFEKDKLLPGEVMHYCDFV